MAERLKFNESVNKGQIVIYRRKEHPSWQVGIINDKILKNVKKGYANSVNHVWVSNQCENIPYSALLTKNDLVVKVDENFFKDVHAPDISGLVGNDDGKKFMDNYREIRSSLPYTLSGYLGARTQHL